MQQLPGSTGALSAGPDTRPEGRRLHEYEIFGDRAQDVMVDGLTAPEHSRQRSWRARSMGSSCAGASQCQPYAHDTTGLTGGLDFHGAVPALWWAVTRKGPDCRWPSIRSAGDLLFAPAFAPALWSQADVRVNGSFPKSPTRRRGWQRRIRLWDAAQTTSLVW
jgi:hypothetical protein